MQQSQPQGTEAPPPGANPPAARRRRWLVVAMAAVAGALSLGLALLRNLG